jgi:ribosomal-protein-alanine N-acetyltransferase
MVDSEIALGFARTADAPELALMSRDLIEAGLGWAYRADRMAQYIGDPDAVVLVARDRQLLAGFAVMRFGDTRAHLVLLAVALPYRRRGIALRMLAWLAESAQVAGIASLHVELRAGNAPARALYRAAGFGETLRIEGYYRGRETAVRMLRQLRAGLAS